MRQYVTTRKEVTRARVATGSAETGSSVKVCAYPYSIAVTEYKQIPGRRGWFTTTEDLLTGS